MKTLTFKVTDEEARRIRAAAKRQRITVSEYLRRRAAGPDPVPAEPQLVKCPHTGAMIFAPLLDAPPLSSESVREMLADFP
ncbi:hypothetical protein [Haloferula sp. BvORR071]|uniref:plasmid mobilization protein n=1 Tax=Haloferula sp. BvORR071 TaxID=1396141 RepID=UPI002240F96A|nr:hypothetical protein [Haloferula sp. BvORR071]